MKSNCVKALSVTRLQVQLSSIGMLLSSPLNMHNPCCNTHLASNCPRGNIASSEEGAASFHQLNIWVGRLMETSCLWNSLIHHQPRPSQNTRHPSTVAPGRHRLPHLQMDRFPHTCGIDSICSHPHFRRPNPPSQPRGRTPHLQ